MAKYRTLGPVLYKDGSVVKQVTKAGVILELTEDQADSLEGSVAYIRDATYSYPRGELFHYPTVDEFPATGALGTLYLADGTSTLHVWDGTEYIQIAGS